MMNRKQIYEKTARILFLICAGIAIFAVCSLTIYMFLKGIPALKEVGIPEFLLGTKWAPTATEPSYGIFYIILSSIVGTASAVLMMPPACLSPPPPEPPPPRSLP